MKPTALEELRSDLAAALQRVQAAVRAVPRPRDGTTSSIPATGHGRAGSSSHTWLRTIPGNSSDCGWVPEPPVPTDAADHEAELDVDAWNGARVSERPGLENTALVDEMRANRRAVIGLLGSLSSEQLDRPFPYRGRPTPLTEMVSSVIGHLDQHARELASCLQPT